jgi:hypothetical protein
MAQDDNSTLETYAKQHQSTRRSPKFPPTDGSYAYRKSNPDIFVMQSAEDRAAKNTPFPLYGAR